MSATISAESKSAGGILVSPAKGSNKKLLGASGITTRSKDATRGSWPYY